MIDNESVVFSGLAGLAVGLAVQFLLGAYCRAARLSLRLLQRRRTQGRQHVQVRLDKIQNVEHWDEIL